MSITIGNTGNALQLTIPTRGDLNWDALLQTVFTAISTHTHDGITAGALISSTSSSETLAASGAISILTAITVMNAAGATAMTLANGVEGQQKLIVNIGAGTSTITPAVAGGNTATLITNASVTYRYLGSRWRATAGNGGVIS